MSDMYGHVTRTGLRRAGIDFALALALFWTLAFALSTHHTKAHAVPLHPGEQMRPSEPERVTRLALFTFEPRAKRFKQLDERHSLGLLSLAFAFLAALNLAFWRHLRRVYASPRRGVWRRG
jgi:hypothetical protein